MKVLLQSRVDLFDKRGGDTVHLEKTKEELKKLGVVVDVSLDTRVDVSSFDLVHLFNIDWVRETYLQCLNAKKQGKKVVLTPIHHRFSEIEDFEKRARYGIRRLVNPIFRSYESREKLKNIYRVLFDLRKGYPTLVQLKVGVRRQQEEVLNLVDLVMPNTTLEEIELKKEFNTDIKSSVVPAGVGRFFATADPSWFRQNYGYISHALLGDFVLAVGRIEPRKNQLKIIEALKKNGIPLVILGNFNKFHPEYSFRVKREIKRSGNIFHIKNIPHENIGSAFAACKVHVLASWFETIGLVNLEAALAGANVVSTNRGYCREYLQNFAWFVDPSSTESIRDGIMQAFNTSRNDKMKTHILKNYTWEKVGEETLKAYEKVI